MSSRQFSELAASEKWLFAGQVTIALGSMFVSIGTLLRIASEGRLTNLQNQSPPPPQREGDSLHWYYQE
jgi:hypothetical protein